MKISHMLAAIGLSIAAVGVSTPAEAQRYDHDQHFDRHDQGHHFGRDRDWRRHGDRNLRRHGYRRSDVYGYGGRGRDRCWTEWRRSHRVRVCR